MRRPRETIDAAMLATAIGIDARFESDIRALIPRNDCFRGVPKILRRPPGLFFVARIGIDNIDIGKIDVQLFEPIRRTPGSAAAVDWLLALRCFLNDRTKFLFPASSHVTRSHEHIHLSSLLTEAGGGGEIRTHEAFRPSGFQDRRIQPLCHPSRQNEVARSVPLLTR